MVKTFKTGAFGTAVYTAAAVSVTNIKASSGTLVRCTVTTGSAGTITFYDAISGEVAGTIVAVIDTTSAANFEFGVNCETGIRWVKTGTASVTVVYI